MGDTDDPKSTDQRRDWLSGTRKVPRRLTALGGVFKWNIRGHEDRTSRRRFVDTSLEYREGVLDIPQLGPSPGGHLSGHPFELPDPEH